MNRLISVEIPAKVAADEAHQNARAHSDKQNARIEHDKALQRVMNALLQDDPELFKQFRDNDGFRRELSDMVFRLTYGPGGEGCRARLLEPAVRADQGRDASDPPN